MGATGRRPDQAERRSTARARVTPGRLVLVAGGLAAVLALFLAVRVPPGLPYDEPSHFSTVEFYADHGRLPVMGDPGVTYEAQMGPVYYGVAAGVLRAADTMTDHRGAFVVVRSLGALVCLALAALSFRTLLLVVPDRPWIAAWATALFVLNPAVVFVVSSVQNDGFVMVAVLAFLLCTLRVIARGTAGWRDGLVIGALAGVAMLTKINSAVVIAPALVAMVAATWRRGAVRVGLTALAVVGALTTWWFVRNQVLYGSVDGRSGIERTGVSFPSAEVTPGSVWRLVRISLFPYLWTPVEYVRNLVRTPPWWTLVAVSASAAAIIGWALPSSIAPPRSSGGPAGRRITPARAVVGIVVVSLVGFVVVYFRSSSLGGRFLYPLFPFVSVAIALGLTRLASCVSARLSRPDPGEAWVLAPLVAAGVIATLQIAVSASNLGPQPFDIGFG